LNILVCGDSFSSYWPNTRRGWVSLLGADYDVDNFSKPGIGEYKILKQVKRASLKDYDLVIVSHTSYSRVHTAMHPVHRGFHKHCDLIYTDIENKFSWFNSSLRTAKNWFRFHYDDEYQRDVYKLVRKEINTLLYDKPYIAISHLPLDRDLAIERNFIDFSSIWVKNKGVINHYSAYGNLEVYNCIKKKMEEIL